MASEIPLNRIINQEIYVPKSGYCGWALVWCPKSNEAGHMNNEGEEGGNLGLEKLQQRGQSAFGNYPPTNKFGFRRWMEQKHTKRSKVENAVGWDQPHGF